MAEFRLAATGKQIDAVAWREDAEIFVSKNTLRSLGLTPEGAGADIIALRDAPGLSYKFEPSEQAVILQCTGACFETQNVSLNPLDAKMPVQAGAGAFLNVDVVANKIESREALAGQFELGLFRPGGFGGASWTMGANGGTKAVRLDTTWTWDMPETRSRLRVGDSIMNSAATGVPFRFGGVQLATDFTIDPTFVTFPTPNFRGEAAAPSSLDLYVNGALRMRDDVNAGPFSIQDTPVVAGAGEARVVVTDALGREQSINIPFYAAPTLLRPGLSQYALAAGAEREQFALQSNQYGDGFVAGLYRRGLTDWATAGGQIQATDAFRSIGAELSMASTVLGQFDFAAATSNGDAGNGGFAKAGWTRLADRLSFSIEGQFASEAFRRTGDFGPPPNTLGRATLGFNFTGLGSTAFSATAQREFNGRRVKTLGFSYSAPTIAGASLGFSALLVDDGRQSSTFGLTLVRALGPGTTALAALDHDGGDMTGSLRLQHSPQGVYGLSWRAAMAAGARGRLDAGMTLRETTYEAQLDASRVNSGSGVRAQFATGFVWMDDALMVSGPVRDSFALVDVGAPNVEVFRDRRSAGRTNLRGRILLTDMRPYEMNRVGVNLDDLPMDARIDTDEIGVKPAARSGAIVKFPLKTGSGGEVRVTDVSGAPLKPGAMLVRDSDGARFPVGRDGRIYVDGAHDDDVLALAGGDACEVRFRVAALGSDAPLQCAGGSLR
ncbi:MAG: fimbria/pilus outer membrane usher protein [Caulobacterales bacterium]